MKSIPSWSGLLGLLGASLRVFTDAVRGGDSPDPEPTPIPPLTARQVQQYALAGGSDAEIADRFLVSEAELREQFADVLRSTRAVRRLSLRGSQFELARNGNASMLTWLGRNELGQSLTPASSGESEPALDEKVG